MFKNVLICWMFGHIDLSPKQIREIIDRIPEEDREDWVKIIENGNLEEYSASVAEVAQQDFIVSSMDFINYGE
jgi:hypothetical protein